MNNGFEAASVARWRHIISPILRDSQPPHFLDSDEIFCRLQARFESPRACLYDPLSTWRRGVERALSVLDHAALQTPGRRVLEMGCGDGMTGVAFASYGHRVILNDLSDWRDDRAKFLPFLLGDVCRGLAVRAGIFDLVYSYNSFEHVDDPMAALAELSRVCSSGGLLYLSFGPLYASPWGLHAHNTIQIPYLQFLFSPEFIATKLQELGVWDLGRDRSELQPTNGWRLGAFDKLLCDSPLEVLSYDRIPAEYQYLQVIREFPSAFRGRGLHFCDVSTQALSVLLRKTRK